MWGVKSAVWSVKCAGSSGKWEVRSVECEVWSVKFQFGVQRAQCEVWSVKCEVWSVKEAVRSEKCEVWTVKCEVWSVECEVWSLECEECSVKCGVWSVKTLLRLSLEKNGCRGKDTVGTGFSSNYRSFIFGKLPPPACPGLCYFIIFYHLLFLSIAFSWIFPLSETGPGRGLADGLLQGRLGTDHGIAQCQVGSDETRGRLGSMDGDIYCKNIWGYPNSWMVNGKSWSGGWFGDARILGNPHISHGWR